jgi:hypothetical protein
MAGPMAAPAKSTRIIIIQLIIYVTIELITYLLLAS